MKKLTQKRFIEKAKEVHGDTYNYDKCSYKTMRDKITLICKEHGDFKILPSSHINQKQGCKECKRYSRLDNRRLTTEQFIEKAKKIHGDKYDYSLAEYIISSKKVKIICKKHGVFEQVAGSHLQGINCPVCGNKNKGSHNKTNRINFIKEANKTHNNFYNYEKVSYINQRIRVEIICPEHGEFKQSPTNHIKGQGCPKCSLERTGWSYENWKNGVNSPHFDSFKVYVIKCWNDEEEFYKIGKTFTTINKRFHKKESLPYNWETLKIYEGTAKEMSKLERKLQKLNKKFVYLPKNKFSGMYECFSKIEDICL